MSKIDHIIDHATPKGVLEDGYREINKILVSLVTETTIDATGYSERARQMHGLIDRLEAFHNHQKQYTQQASGTGLTMKLA